MFEVTIEKETIEEVKKFMDANNPANTFVQVMNNAGLDITSMAFILDSIFEGIKRAEARLNKEENNATSNN